MSLKDRLIRQIRMDGPLSVSAYMQTCLHDPADGYYAQGAGLGRDFITAPETSQMFGELIGLWAVHQWQAFDTARPMHLVELGPGRGTLMANALRALRPHVSPDGLKLCLMEASPVLRKTQTERLAAWQPTFISGLSGLPAAPFILIANEFLDCLPVRQFVREGDVWRERIVGLNDAGTLAFGIDRSDLTLEAASDLSPNLRSAEAELQPGLDGLVDELAACAARGGTFQALFIDYGPTDTPPGDTLRAYKAGEQVHPLAAPGASDLTVDVDFGRLARLAERAGLTVSGPVTQAAFLGSLGLQARLDHLIKQHPDKAELLFTGAQKLVDPSGMGTRFKVICLSTPGVPTPAGFG